MAKANDFYEHGQYNSVAVLHRYIARINIDLRHFFVSLCGSVCAARLLIINQLNQIIAFLFTPIIECRWRNQSTWSCPTWRWSHLAEDWMESFCVAGPYKWQATFELPAINKTHIRFGQCIWMQKIVFTYLSGQSLFCVVVRFKVTRRNCIASVFMSLFHHWCHKQIN